MIDPSSSQTDFPKYITAVIEKWDWRSYPGDLSGAVEYGIRSHSHPGPMQDLPMIKKLKRHFKMAVLRTMNRRQVARRERSGIGPNLPPDLWGLELSPNGHLMVDGCDMTDLAAAYGTPLHVVSESRLEANYENFLGAFRSTYPHVEVAYSYKTNPIPGILQALHRMGACAEVMSPFELWLALKLGVAPDKIVFNGPVKPRSALELAISKCIGLINLDSEAEIDLIADLAKTQVQRQGVGVRVLPSVGWPALGIPIANGRAFHAFERLSGIEQLHPHGIHMHLGTGIRDVGAYSQAIREVLEFSRTLRERLGINIRYFDLGGGFGVETVQNYSGWDRRLMLNGLPSTPIDTAACPSFETYGKEIGRLIKWYLADEPPVEPVFLFEPGRAMTSSAQCLLLTLVVVKEGLNNVTYAIADGGKNIAMPLGSEHHEVFPASRMMDPTTDILYHVGGPLSYPDDILYKAKRFPKLHAGDLLAIMDSGAYFTSQEHNFSSPRPAVVMTSRRGHQLLRQRESFDDMISLDRMESAIDGRT